MGQPEVQAKPSVVLKVTLEEGEWKEVAKVLSIKLLKLKGVTCATIGEKGTITLQYDKTAPDEETVKKLVKEAGMKYVSMLAPKAEPAPKKNID